MRRFLGIALVAGLLLAIAMAQAGAFTQRLTRAEFRNDAAPPAFVPSGWTMRTWLDRRGPGIRYHLVSESVWMGSRLGMSESTAPNRTLIVVECGWPLPAMRWREAYHAAHLSKVARGIAIPGPGLERRLPLEPLWGGLAADTLILGAAAWAFTAGPCALRRYRRRIRGQCTSCGYLLGDLARCPECGGAAPRTRNAGDRNRTCTGVSAPADFESAASASSATPAGGNQL